MVSVDILERHRRTVREFLAGPPFGYRDLSDEELHLFSMALVHDSFSNEHGIPENNERLEFLGDAVLEFVACEHIYLNTDFNEGAMTENKQKIVCNSAISEAVLASGINLDGVILTGNGHTDSVTGRPEINETMRSDAFEAMLGAIYLTKGTDEVRRVVRQILIVHAHI